MKDILWINAKFSEKKAVKNIERAHQQDLELLNSRKISKEEFQLRCRNLIKELDDLKAEYDILYEKEDKNIE